MGNVRFKMRRNPDGGVYLTRVYPEYRYTVGKGVDADLAGTRGKLLMVFEEGSHLEVTVDQVLDLMRGE